MLILCGMVSNNGTQMNIHFTISSKNSKVGPMLVTTQSSDTCYSGCPFNGSGCYAHIGPIAIHWRKVDNGERDKGWNEFLKAVKSQQPGSLWRMSQAGDLPGVDGVIDADRLNDVVNANRRMKGFTYTHKPLTETNKALIKDANERGFTINLSANSLSDADEKAALGIGPVAVPIDSDPDNWPTHTPAGRRIVVCPHSTKGIKCTQCGLCQKAKRKSIVGFPAHGVAKRKVVDIINRGTSLEARVEKMLTA